MEFRKSTKKDIKEIMDIIKQAQSYFKIQGINQWQNGYPNEEVINIDVNKGHSYVLLKENKIVATVAISFDGEKNYDTIYEGAWLTNDTYGVIHRIAVSNNYKSLGLSHKIIKYTEKLCKDNNINSIKVDTHIENMVMQNLLKRNDFKYCGVIYLDDGDKRVAFEKII